MLTSIRSVAKLFVLVAIISPSIAQAAGSNQAKPQYIMVSTVATADIELTSRTVSVVTSDDRFANVSINPSAKISQANKGFPIAQVTSGFVLNCKGTWNENALPPTFRAEYVFVGKRLQECEVRERISAACKAITAQGDAQRAANPTPPSESVRPVQTAPVEDKPAIASPEKKEPPPQVEIIDFEWKHQRGYSHVFCKIKNISDVPLAGTAATVDFYNDDDEYVASSKTIKSLIPAVSHGLTSVKPGEEDMFQIETRWLPDAFPGITQCKIEFQSNNLGALRLHPADDVLRR